MTPSLIITNARMPLHAGSVPPTALAVRNGRIAAIGADTDIAALAGPGTERIDAEGRWLLPGLTDSHTHLVLAAIRTLQVDLSDSPSLEDALARVSARVAVTPEGEWVVGGGWDRERWGMDTLPHRRMLDAISQRHPIVLQSRDWHSLWVNGAALAAAGIDAASADPPGGWILRDSDGGPSGILQETACAPLLERIPSPPIDTLRPALRDTIAALHRHGITAVHSVDTDGDFPHLEALHHEGLLDLRVAWYFPAALLESDRHPALGGDDILRICGVKLFADGSLGSQTAHMIDPYHLLGHRGVAVHTPERLRAIIATAVAGGFPCAVHAIGDAANRDVLAAFAAVAESSRGQGLRHRIEHAQHLRPESVAEFARLGIAASMQPVHLAGDVPLIDRFLGSERRAQAYPFRSLQNAGIRLAFGSDMPIETFDPWKGMYMAVARKPFCDPERDTYVEEETLSLMVALRAYALNPIALCGDRSREGGLLAGRAADLILLDRSLDGAAPETLLDTRVVLTVQDGVVRHRAL